jgi:predicted permease
VSQPSFIRRHFGSLLWIVIVMTTFGVLLKNNATAREIVGEGFAVLFGFFTTPFILESSSAVVGLLILLQWNQWQRRKDVDEWVEMEVPVRPSRESDKADS